MKEQIEKLLKDLEGMKAYINKGDEALDLKYAETAESVAKLLSDSEKLQGDFAETLKANEKLALRVEYLEKFFGKSKKTVSLEGLKDEKEQFSLLKAMYAIQTGDWSDAKLEKAVFDETKEKAGQNTQDNSAGGFIVPREVSQDIIELLRPESVLIKLGATVLSDLSGGSWEVPAGKGGIVTYWVGEGLSVTESEESFGQVILRPKEIAAMVRMSLNFAKRARPDAENYIRGRLAQELALAIDLAGFMGTGGDYQPYGLWNIAGISEVNVGDLTDGGEFKPEHIVDLEGKLEDSEALRGRLGLLWHPKMKRKLKKERIANFTGQTDGNYVFPGFDDKSLAEFLGYEFETTTQLPTNIVVGADSDVSPIFFGNWQDFLLGQWGNLEIAVATQAGDVFEKRQMLMRISQEVDCNVARKESFTKVPDAKST